MLRKLAGQTAIYGISSIVARMFNFLLTPYLTRILTTGEYGVYSDMYALIPFALVVLTLGMESGYFRFAGKAQSDSERRVVFSTAWGLVSAAAVIFMAAVLIFTPQIAAVMRYGDHPSYIRIVGAIVMLDVITAIPFARLREEGRSGRFVMVRSLSILITLVFTLFFYSALPRMAAWGGIWASLYDPQFGAGYAFVANLIASAATLLMLRSAYRDTMPRIDRKTARTIFLYSLPLLVSGIAGTANDFIDRQMIKYLMPEQVALDAVGIYSAVTRIGVILVLFTQMYRYAAEPFFLASFRKEDFVRANAEATKFFILVSVAIFLFIALYLPLFGLILGADFRQGIHILPLVMLANILAGTVVNLSFWYKQTGKTQIAILITGTGFLFTLALNLLLIPRLGYTGAAWARLGCETAMVALSYFLNRKYYPIPYDLKRIGYYLLLGGAIFAAALLTGGLSAWIRYPLNTVLLILFLVSAVRKERIDVRGLALSILKRKQI